MNKSRSKQSSISILEISILVATAMIVMLAGVTHACLRNSHVEVMRSVDKAQQRIEEHKDAVNSLQVKIDKKLNIYQLRDDLERSGSELVIVPTTSIEKISAHTLTGVASTGENISTIASITP